MELLLQREASKNLTTFGELFIRLFAGSSFLSHECLTLEDQIREVAGQPVASWKVQNETAIPAGRYRITLEDSPRFGPDTITINNVPGFTSIRMHGGNNKDDTDGCVLVGDKEDRAAMTIAGAKFDHVLDQLKVKVKAAIVAGEEVWITILNPSTLAVAV